MNESVKMSEVEDYLIHHGVKGMKWGVRKASSGESSSGSSKLETTSKIVDNAKTFIKDPRNQKRLVASIAVSGSAAVATMLAGPIGGISVSVVGRALNSAID